MRAGKKKKRMEQIIMRSRNKQDFAEPEPRIHREILYQIHNRPFIKLSHHNGGPGRLFDDPSPIGQGIRLRDSGIRSMSNCPSTGDRSCCLVFASSAVSDPGVAPELALFTAQRIASAFAHHLLSCSDWPQRGPKLFKTASPKKPKRAEGE